MKLLIDTHILLWALGKNPRLPKRAALMLEDRRNKVWVSVATIWELAIKQGLHKIEIDFADLENNLGQSEFDLISISYKHAVQVSELPMHHSDPFDRMLIAQATVEGAHLLTSDTQLSMYGKSIMLV